MNRFSRKDEDQEVSPKPESDQYAGMLAVYRFLHSLVWPLRVLPWIVLLPWKGYWPYFPSLFWSRKVYILCYKNKGYQCQKRNPSHMEVMLAWTKTNPPKSMPNYIFPICTQMTVCLSALYRSLFQKFFMFVPAKAHGKPCLSSTHESRIP